MFPTAGGTPSIADIAAVTRNNDGYGNGWGGDGGWWVLIILLALFGGFGGYGYGGRNGENNQFTDAAVQRGFDNQSIMNKLNGIEQGICSLGYDQLAQMNGINTNIMQTAFGLERTANNNALSNLQALNNLSTQMGSCCCDIKGGLKDIQFTMAQNDCATRTAIHETGDSILNTINWSSRNLSDTMRDGFTEIQRQNDQRYIAELERKLNNSDRQAELRALAADIKDSLSPCPRPAWLACNPNTGMTIPQMGIDQIRWALEQQNGCNCNSWSNGCCNR